MSTEELSFLAKTASELKDDSIVFEIGSFCGRSARALADNSPRNCKIYCIDPWEYMIYGYDMVPYKVDESTFGQFFTNLHDHIESSKVTPVMMKWEEYIPHAQADLIFIDGDHSYKSVKHDIVKALGYIKPGGMISGHDYQNFDGVQKAVNERFSEVNVEESIWWTRKS